MMDMLATSTEQDPSESVFEKSRRIAVIGDVRVDQLEVSVPATPASDPLDRTPLNWQLYPRLQSALRPGGALLLARVFPFHTEAYPEFLK